MRGAYHRGEMATSDDGTVGESPSPGVRALRRAAGLAALGYLLVVASFLTVIIGSWSANRPHEVRGEGLFFGLLGAHVVVGLLVLLSLVSAWRRRREARFRLVHLLPVALAGSYALLVLGYFGRIGWIELVGW